MKSYQQYCGVARALDRVGERWTLLIVRDLLLGPRRYTDLRRALCGLTTNLLALRLKQMTQLGLIRQRELPPPAATAVYELTELGRQLEPVVLALGRFGAQFMKGPELKDRLDPRWAMLSLKRRYRGSTLDAKIHLQVDDLDFTMWLKPNEIDVADGVVGEVDARLSGSFATWSDLFSGRSTLRELLASAQFQRNGPLRLIQQIVQSLGFRP